MENAPWDTSVGNRFAFNGPDDHTGPLWIAALLGIIYTAGVLTLRIYIKRRVLGWDDYLIIASSVSISTLFLALCLLTNLRWSHFANILSYATPYILALGRQCEMSQMFNF